MGKRTRLNKHKRIMNEEQMSEEEDPNILYGNY